MNRSPFALAFVLLCAFACAPGMAATQFNIPDASRQYAARIEVESCDADACSGPATVHLLDRATGQPVQSFKTEDLSIMLDHAKPAVNNTQLYSDQSAIIIADFNFDGSEDLAIRNGNNSGYGGPSYDVYVYNATRKRFVPSAELTELASSKLGMFQIDSKRRRLITFEKAAAAGTSPPSTR